MATEPRETYGLAPILTVNEAATFLRMNKKSVYQAVEAGELPGKRIGRRVVIPRDRLLDSLLGKSCVLPRKRGK